MPRFGIPNQGHHQRFREIAQVNWRRGLFRVWLLLSAAWTMLMMMRKQPTKPATLPTEPVYGTVQ